MKHFKFLFDSGKYFETYALNFRQACLNADDWMKQFSLTPENIMLMEETTVEMQSRMVH